MGQFICLGCIDQSRIIFLIGKIVLRIGITNGFIGRIHHSGYAKQLWVASFLHHYVLYVLVGNNFLKSSEAQPRAMHDGTVIGVIVSFYQNVAASINLAGPKQIQRSNKRAIGIRTVCICSVIIATQFRHIRISVGVSVAVTVCKSGKQVCFSVVFGKPVTIYFRILDCDKMAHAVIIAHIRRQNLCSGRYGNGSCQCGLNNTVFVEKQVYLIVFYTKHIGITVAVDIHQKILFVVFCIYDGHSGT